jgi:hypothetical protein
MRTLRNVSFLILVSVLMVGPSLGADEACSGFGGPSSCCMVGFTFNCDQYCVASGYGSGGLAGSCTAEVAGDTYEGETCWCEGPLMDAAAVPDAQRKRTPPASGLCIPRPISGYGESPVDATQP